MLPNVLRCTERPLQQGIPCPKCESCWGGETLVQPEVHSPTWSINHFIPLLTLLLFLNSAGSWSQWTFFSASQFMKYQFSGYVLEFHLLKFSFWIQRENVCGWVGEWWADQIDSTFKHTGKKIFSLKYTHDLFLSVSLFLCRCFGFPRKETHSS